MQLILQELAQLLQQRQWCIGTAESCTGGMVAMQITSMAGSSQWFNQGIVSYSNAVKQRLLQVDEALLMTYGAVSTPVALAMAKGVLALDPHTHLAISTTGIAGPGGGTAQKPVGLVCFALATAKDERVWQVQFDGDRHAVRQQATTFILTQAVHYLQELSATASLIA